MTNVRSLRFAKFVQVINPAYSFDDIAILYNFSLKEVEVYVLHLLIHQKGILLNKLTGESIFTLNPAYKFDYSIDTKKLSEKFF